MHNVTLYKTKKKRIKECDISLKSKVEIALNSFPVKLLQRALHILQDKENRIQFSSRLSIARDVPLHPHAELNYTWDDDNQHYNQPMITGLLRINYGTQDEVRLPSPGKFPMLTTLLNHLQKNGCDFKNESELAKQLAPALGLTGKWYEPVFMESGNSWQEAKIEYEQFPLALKKTVDQINIKIHAIRDYDGCIRHLVCEQYVDGEVVTLPITFAQHPNYRTPMVCHFAYSPEWWLMGSEQLQQFPKAEVCITNDLHCKIYGSSMTVIFLRYLFGKDMIPYLKLECLKWRIVKVLFIRNTDKQEMRVNLEEVILLMSRLKKLDIKAEIMQINDDEPLNQEISDSGLPNVVFHYKPEKVGIEKIVTLGISYGIKIPENLRPDRYGTLIARENKTLVNGFLNAGEITVVTIHTGVNLTLIACSIMTGLNGGSVFGGKWTCNQKMIPALFVKGITWGRYKNYLEQLSADNCICHELPSGNKDTIETTLYHIVKEKNCNILLFAGRQIVQESRKELEIISNWGRKNGVDIVFITSQEDRAADTFFSDICSRDIYFWWTEKNQHEYLVEDRPLLLGRATAFKIKLNSSHQWIIVEEHAEDELHDLMDRNVKILNTETIENNNPILDPITQYRR